MMRCAYSDNDFLPDAFGLGMDNFEILHELLLDVEQQLARTNLIKADDADAKSWMITDSLQLVVNIAKRYINSGVAFLDLVREGILGLIHALEKFELEGGFHFPPYARLCIREKIEQAIRSRNNYLCMPPSQITPSWMPGVMHAEH